jgi:hypothetical protein
VKLSQVIPNLPHLGFGGFAGLFQFAVVLEGELDELLFQTSGFIFPFLQFGMLLG